MSSVSVCLFEDMASKVCGTKTCNKTAGDYSVLSGGDMRAGRWMGDIRERSVLAERVRWANGGGEMRRLVSKMRRCKAGRPLFHAVKGVSRVCAAA
jgi:hypothetical protein